MLALLGILSGAKSFIIAQWRIILPVLIVLCAYWYVTHLQSQRDVAIANLNSYKAQQLDLAAKQAIENQRKVNEANSKLALANTKYEAEFKRLNLNRDKSTKAIKAYYENRNASVKSNYDTRLRLEAINSASRVRDASSNTSTLAEGGRNSDTAFDTLEQACMITTLDYNQLREWADVACETVGCK